MEQRRNKYSTKRHSHEIVERYVHLGQDIGINEDMLTVDLNQRTKIVFEKLNHILQNKSSRFRTKFKL